MSRWRRPASPARTAGDGNHLTRDEGRLVAAQKRNEVGDVARHAGPAHRDLPDDLLLPLLGVAAEADRDGPRHLGVDKTGGDGVDGDAIAAEFDRQGAR